jgi:hypothetical protein
MFLCVMIYRFLLAALLIFSQAIGQAEEIPQVVLRLMEQTNPKARLEYCGAISTKNLCYHLFVVTCEELAGVVLVRNSRGDLPIIVDADTSLFFCRTETPYSLGKAVQAAIADLLERRNLKRQGQIPLKQITPSREVCCIGRNIDRVIFPITGFQLGSESTHEIMNILRTTHAISVEPANAPPGSIIVSPTRFSAHGPFSIGHAGIVGPGGSIYSADARYGGAWVRNFTLGSWLSRFSASNGTYTFLLRDRSHSKSL